MFCPCVEHSFHFSKHFGNVFSNNNKNNNKGKVLLIVEYSATEVLSDESAVSNRKLTSTFNPKLLQPLRPKVTYAGKLYCFGSYC